MSKKITGVVVDIPTVIKEAKLVRSPYVARIHSDEHGFGVCCDCKKPIGWISVADRLPERNTPVIVYENTELNPEILCAEYVDDNYWRVHIDGCRFYQVSHWMPLPEPPKVKE